MTIKFCELNPNTKDRIRRDNPDVFRPLAAEKSKSVGQRRCKDSELERGPESVRYCVTLIALRRRLLDSHDNARSAMKPLVDKITDWLGFKSDADERIIWQYAQVKSDGPQGVAVLIQIL
jgi:hypothetical protein